jgi:hypothetical protein
VGEVGVAEGDFSERILSITSPQVLHLIDAWGDGQYRGLRSLVENKLRNEIDQGQVVIHQGRSISELVRFKDNYFDWVYLDTSHDYKTTSMELELCRRKVKTSGIIAGHDYVTGSWVYRLRYGVIEAVHEFCMKYDWELLYLTHESHRHLSFAIRQLSTSGPH